MGEQVVDAADRRVRDGVAATTSRLGVEGEDLAGEDPAVDAGDLTDALDQAGQPAALVVVVALAHEHDEVDRPGDQHVRRLDRQVLLGLQRGRVGETYNIGGWNEQANIDIVRLICTLLDELVPDPQGPYARLITHVQDRPGHDRRYAIDARKIERELGWRPAESFETGLRKTVEWYLANPGWVENVTSGAYREWVSKQYGEASPA